MTEEVDAETAQILAGLNPAIADLIRQMLTSRPANWPEAKALRDRIVALNKIAASNEEQTSICFAFTQLMGSVEQDQLVAPESLEQLKKIGKADYLHLLNQQALVGDLIDPGRLAEITRREVEAGRLAPDDDFRKLAEAGGRVLGNSRSAEPRKGWFARIFG